MNKNINLAKAKKEKNNEFYTMLSDIENELKYYREQFRGKVVYCNWMMDNNDELIKLYFN